MIPWEINFVVKVCLIIGSVSSALDVTLVNEFPLVRSGNDFSYLKCVIGDGVTLSHAPFERVLDTGSGSHLTSMSLVGPVATGEWRGKKLSMYPEAKLQRTGVFSCKATDSTNGDVKLVQAIKIGTGGGVWPEEYTKVVSDGDVNVELIFKSFDVGKKLVWRHNGNLLNAQSLVYTIHSVTPDDAGVYECYNVPDGEEPETYRPLTQGIMRLIVRQCPHGRWSHPYCARQCTCINGGACDDVTGNCICGPGFWGDNCEKGCGGNRFGSKCQFHCKQGGSTTGDDAEECKLRQFCLPDPYGCSCAAGFKGIECDQACPIGQFGANCVGECHCKSHDLCNRFTGTCVMGCGAGWTGPSCQEECSEGFWGRDCKMKCHCKDDQACNRITGECPDGLCTHPFSGSSCQIDALDECSSNPCQHDGTCIDEVLAYTCECIFGVTGINCEIDMDDCLSSPCLNDGICTDTGPEQFSCSCVPGFRGELCEENIDDCEEHKCVNFITCVDQIQAYACNCIAGYTGSLCQDSCSAGTFYNSVTKRCEKCEKGTYQPLTAKEFCIPCPSGTITKDFGSDNESECVSSALFGNAATSDTLVMIIAGILGSIVFIVVSFLIWYYACHKKKNRLEKVDIRTAW